MLPESSGPVTLCRYEYKINQKFIKKNGWKFAPFKI